MFSKVIVTEKWTQTKSKETNFFQSFKRLTLKVYFKLEPKLGKYCLTMGDMEFKIRKTHLNH